MPVAFLNPLNPFEAFPPAESAETDPDGLLAVGGCLSPQRLLNAYRHGIFPWYNPGEPILWWSPNPRLIIYPHRLHVSHSLAKAVKKQRFRLSFDQNFSAVMQACAKPRTYANGTWISKEILQAYQQLFHLGVAHSIEVWQDDELVGGLYGVAIGKVFFGESMFHSVSNASKIAFVYLAQHLQDWQYELIDCQVNTSHLESLGAENMPRAEFIDLLEQFCPQTAHPLAWCLP